MCENVNTLVEQNNNAEKMIACMIEPLWQEPLTHVASGDL